MRAWRPYTRGRFESAHGVRFERIHTGEGWVCGGEEGGGGQRAHQHQHQHIAHQQHTQRTTNKRTTHNTNHARGHRQFCFPKFAHVGLSLDPRSSTIHFQFENRSRSNHSLYMIKLFNFSNLEGSFGGNQQPDGSSGLSPSPPPLPPPPQQQHNTQRTETQTQRHRDTETTTQRLSQNPSIANDLHVRHFQ